MNTLQVSNISDTIANTPSPDAIATPPVPYIAAQPDSTWVQIHTQPITCEFSLDTIFAARDLPQCTYRTSPFAEHQLQVQHPRFLLRNTDNLAPLYFCILVGLSLLLCFFFRGKRIKLTDLTTSAISNRNIGHLIREKHFDGFLSHIICTTLFSLTLSLFINYVIVRISPAGGIPYLDPSHIGGFMLLLLCIWCFFLVRNGLIRLLGNIFDNNEATKVCVASNYTYTLLETLIMIPLLLILYFTPWGGHPHSATILIVTAIPLALLFVMRLFRGMQIILTFAKDTKFYLFYYLCIVEIVPLAVLAKVCILI